MRKQLHEFALSLHSEKTRLIEFGRFAAESRNALSRRTPNSDIHYRWLSLATAKYPHILDDCIERKSFSSS